jgi:hypothetical protein
MGQNVETIISGMRGELAETLGQLDTETGRPFWEDFRAAANRFRAGRMWESEFRAVVGVLDRDACKCLPAEAVRPERGRLPRSVWAWFAVVAVILAAAVGVLAAVLITEARDHDRDMLTRGGEWSWTVANGCAEGPAECERVLHKVNADASRYGVRVYEDGSVTPR